MQESIEDCFKQIKKDLRRYIDAAKEKTRDFKVGDIEDIDKQIRKEVDDGIISAPTDDVTDMT